MHYFSWCKTHKSTGSKIKEKAFVIEYTTLKAYYSRSVYLATKGGIG
jgi:hypothetical protein